MPTHGFDTVWLNNLATAMLEHPIDTANEATEPTIITREEVEEMLEDYTHRIYVAIHESAKLDVTEDEFVNLVKEIR